MPLDLNKLPERGGTGLDLSVLPPSQDLFSDTIKEDGPYADEKTLAEIIDTIRNRVSSSTPATSLAVSGVPTAQPEVTPTPESTEEFGGGMKALLGAPEGYDPTASYVSNVGQLAKNATVGAEDAILSILTLPQHLVEDPKGTLKAMAMYGPEQINNVIKADLLNIGNVFKEKNLNSLIVDDDSEWLAQRDEARDKLFRDPLGPIFAYQIAKGVGKLTASGTDALKSAMKKTDAKVSVELADDLFPETVPETIPEALPPGIAGLLPDYSKMAVPVNKSYAIGGANRRVPPAPGMNAGFEATATPGGSVGLDLNVVPSASRGVAPPGNIMTEMARQKAQSKPGFIATAEPSMTTKMGAIESIGASDMVRLERFARERDIKLESLERSIERRSKADPLATFGDTPPETSMPSVGAFKRFVANMPRNAQEAAGRDAVFDRASQLHFRQMQLSNFVTDNKKRFTPKELEEMRYYREKTKNPNTDAEPDLSPKAKQFVDEVVGPRFDKLFNEIVEAGYLDDASKVENFVSHFWAGKSKAKKGFSDLVMKARTGRKIPTYYDGVKMGLKPIGNSILEDLARYEEYNARVIANNELVRGLQEIVDDEGNSLVQPLTKKNRHLLDEGWALVDSHALGKAVYVTRRGKTGKPVTIMRFPKTLVHPDLKPSVKRVFDEPFSVADNPTAALWRSYRSANTYAKAVQLSVSLFHPFALTESALGTGSLRHFGYGRKLMKSDDFLKEATGDGVMFGPSYDVGANMVRNGLMKIEARTSGVPIVNKASKFLRGFNDVYNKLLWDEYHNGLKAYSYYSMKAKMLEKFPDRSPKIVGEEVAKFVNDAFGGQNWDRMLMNPNVQEALHGLFLAPDWGLSNVRLATRPFQGKYEGQLRARFAGLSEEAAKEFASRQEIQGKLGRRYWARQAMYSFLGMQFLNYISTGHPTWENDPGQEYAIALPWKNEKGQRVYANPGKQVKEVLRWVTDLPVNLGTKMAPIARWGFEELGGVQAGSSFPMPWREEPITGRKPSFAESIPERMKHTAQVYVPFSFGGDNFAFTLPRSVGMTNYRFSQMYMDAYENDDKAMMERLKISARMNGLDVTKLVNTVKGKIKGKKRYDKKND